MISKNNFADCRINIDTLCLAIDQVLKFIEDQEKIGNISKKDGIPSIALEYLKRTKDDDEVSIYYP